MERAVIIGGGAAGMMAAVTAARRGVETILLERNERCGRKLAITGKGRCNLTNSCDISEFFLNIPTNPKFLYSALYSFSNTDCISFFENAGVLTKTERGGRVFPVSDKASDVVGALRRAMNDARVSVRSERAEEILTREGAIYAVKTDKGITECSGVVIATGGASYPQTGSDGDGYKMAKALGHKITPLTPSLVPLEAEDTMDLCGLSLKNVVLDVRDAQGRSVFCEMGEMLFTHFGLSGPLVLSASSHMKNGSAYSAHIDLKCALDEKKLDARVLRDFEKYSRREASNVLDDLLPAKMRPYIIKRWGIDAQKKVCTVTKGERAALCALLKDLEFKITGFRPISEAIITSGGVDVSGINAHTMESKIVHSLYFAGEVIDVDAYTGGFNLQIAFSTAYLAGMNICAKKE